MSVLGEAAAAAAAAFSDRQLPLAPPEELLPPRPPSYPLGTRDDGERRPLRQLQHVRGCPFAPAWVATSAADGVFTRSTVWLTTRVRGTPQRRTTSS